MSACTPLLSFGNSSIMSSNQIYNEHNIMIHLSRKVLFISSVESFVRNNGPNAIIKAMETSVSHVEEININDWGSNDNCVAPFLNIVSHMAIKKLHISNFIFNPSTIKIFTDVLNSTVLTHLLLSQCTFSANIAIADFDNLCDAIMCSNVETLEMDAVPYPTSLKYCEMITKKLREFVFYYDEEIFDPTLFDTVAVSSLTHLQMRFEDGREHLIVRLLESIANTNITHIHIICPRIDNNFYIENANLLVREPVVYINIDGVHSRKDYNIDEYEEKFNLAMQLFEDNYTLEKVVNINWVDFPKEKFAIDKFFERNIAIKVQNRFKRNKVAQ